MIVNSYHGYGHKDPIRIRLIDLVVLLDNVVKGAKEKDVGFEDSNQTLKDLINSLNKEIQVEKPDLESMLWSCNLMSESNSFWHPDKVSFKSFVKGLLRGRTFNFVTHLIDENRGVSNVE